ncbi:unnamed protein product [Larinioides sclopetarius]|uniref:C2H2-type domain-containing protein n=1 Tax=Larinioides sclopetarius TaxID=280406 RepID=A0AAV2AVV9_9ARAC
MEHEQPINAYVCQYCKGSFDKLENLNKHVQKIHTVCSSGKENRICPLCGTQCIKIEGYRNHLRHIHGHNEEGQVVIFKSFNDFLVWKNELEKRNYCKYVMRNPPKKLPSNDKIHIYRCDSSAGSMKEKRSGVAAKESCPAVITAIESAKTKGVKIEHWNSHVGHIIPVEEDELDAAIGSLGTTEIVLTSDQRYQYEGQSADGNIFFITESNDGSLSETFVKEVSKKSHLFQNTKAKVSDNFSKPASQKFSYKKDPTKKSGSFNYSLASVACMKPSAKKKIITPPAVTTTCSVEDNANTTVTNSDALLTTPISSVTRSEVELAAESINDVINVDISSKINIPVNAKEKETPAILASPSKSTSSTNSSSITNQTFEFINDGSLSGQVVLLNSLPGQNGSQNVLLCPDQKFISIGPAINVGTISPKKGKGSKKSRKNNAVSQIIVIPTASEKENVSSVQNILNLSQNSIPLDSVVRSPGPSILKKAKKSVQKSPKKSMLSTGKNITFTGKNAVSSAKKAISAEQKLNLGLNPSLDVTVVDAIDLTQSATSSFRETDKVSNSVSLEVINSTPYTSNTNIDSVSSIQDTATTSSSNISSKTVLSAFKNIVSSVSQCSVSSVSQSPVSLAVQSSVSSTAQSSVSSTAQSSVSSTVQNSVSSTVQNSVSSTVQNSASTIQNSVSSAVQHSAPSSIQPVNPILLNSFPPGQTFMSINNNLIPIGTPTAPLLPSNFGPGFVLTSPVPPSPVARPVRPMMTYSRLASRLPVASSTLPIGSSDKRIQNKHTNIGTAASLKTPPHSSAVPLLLIPNSGSQIRPSVPFSSPFVASSVNSTLSPSIRPIRTQPIISNPLISSSGCSVLPRPLLSNSGTPVFTQLSPGTRLISTPMIPSMPAPFLSNSGQQISRPLLQNVPLLTNPGQQVPRSILQSISFPAPLIGQPAVVPVAPRAIISTTVSNTIKVQKVQLPFSKTTATNLIVTPAGISSVSSNLSESTRVSSVVLSTEPISSAPAISIPPITSIGSHKAGSVIFESQGDMYMLEPVEENSSNNTTSNTSVRNVPNKMSIAVPSVNGNIKTNKSDEVRESAFEGNKTNLSSFLKEKAVESQSILDTRVDGKVKSLSPRKNTDIKNGVQIKSVVQEKRHLKDDDVEILKKVKYYQMEMKYLSSQAECKRLKLELAKAQKKNKEIAKNGTDLLSNEISMKENADEDTLHIDVTSDKDNSELKETSSANVTENMAMDIDDASHEVSDKITCVLAIDNTESTNQCDADSSDSNHCSDIQPESGCSNCGDNSPVDSDDSNHSEIVSQSLKEDPSKDSLDNQNSNNDLESMNCDIEPVEVSNLETQKETHSALNEELQNINMLENESNSFNSCDQTYKTDSNEELKDINKSELLKINNSSENQLQKLDDELMDFNEIEENLESATEDIQTIKNSENGIQIKVQDLSDKEILVQNNNLDDKVHLVQHNEFCQQKTANAEEVSMDLDNQNNNSFESEKVSLPCEKTQFQETLKDLEIQYGSEESSDIYTMIRTSVLRSLYEDMKTLCEENKKLYEKLQKCRSPEKSCETDKPHSF